jgi:hypothetical protein
MKKSNHLFKFIALSVIALLVFCTALLGFNSIRLSRQLDQVRIEKESLLSEKMHLSRTLEELHQEINTLNDKKTNNNRNNN